MDVWKRHADCGIRAKGCVWGNIHAVAAKKGLDYLFEQSKHSPTQFIPESTFDVYEGLWWKYLEEIKDERRRLTAKSGLKNPDHQEWHLIVTTPVGPNLEPAFNFPNTWGLEDEDGYYQTEILPRLYRKGDRNFWAGVHGACKILRVIDSSSGSS